LGAETPCFLAEVALIWAGNNYADRQQASVWFADLGLAVGRSNVLRLFRSTHEGQNYFTQKFFIRSVQIFLSRADSHFIFYLFWCISKLTGIFSFSATHESDGGTKRHTPRVAIGNHNL
jgi:hypothetical protein